MTAGEYERIRWSVSFLHGAQFFKGKIKLSGKRSRDNYLPKAMLALKKREVRKPRISPILRLWKKKPLKIRKEKLFIAGKSRRGRSSCWFLGEGGPKNPSHDFGGIRIGEPDRKASPEEIASCPSVREQAKPR